MNNTDRVPVLDMIQTFPKNKVSAVAGGILGAVVPLISFNVMHSQIDISERSLIIGAKVTIVVAALLFSAVKVSTIAATITNSRTLGIAYTILLELALLFTEPVTSYAALAILVSLNSISYAYAMTQAKTKPAKQSRVKPNPITQPKANKLTKALQSRKKVAA
jgi:hypothetical protein